MRTIRMKYGVEPFRIVGSEEIYGRDDYITVDSLMARACIGKEVNDEVIFRSPSGEKSW